MYSASFKQHWLPQKRESLGFLLSVSIIHASDVLSKAAETWLWGSGHCLTVWCATNNLVSSADKRCLRWVLVIELCRFPGTKVHTRTPQLHGNSKETTVWMGFMLKLTMHGPRVFWMGRLNVSCATNKRCCPTIRSDWLSRTTSTPCLHCLFERLSMTLCGRPLHCHVRGTVSTLS